MKLDQPKPLERVPIVVSALGEWFSCLLVELEMSMGCLLSQRGFRTVLHAISCTLGSFVWAAVPTA